MIAKLKGAQLLVKLLKPEDKEQITDGYHTFKEL